MATDAEIIDAIQLINTDKIGPVTFYKLAERFGSVAKAIESYPMLQKGSLFERRKAELELKRAAELGVTILLWSDPAYPQRLLELEDAPPVLYCRGNPEILNNPLSLSIVGARNASINGRKTASRIAYDLTTNQVLIVSGMARGIDSAAHKGAMYAFEQRGPTIAVLGTGVDVVYPKENQELYGQICTHGAVISELPLGTLPQANNFPRRNRIVSALGLGTLVVEASLNSGSLITARLALEQGKDIFAIPGSPSEGRSLGPNKLIKDGAILVENSTDILNILNSTNHQQIKAQLAKPLKPSPAPSPNLIDASEALPKSAADESSTKIIDYLSRDGVYVDELIRASGLSPDAVALELVELELNGEIERLPGNRVALIKKHR